jgi:hypothetical protein
MVLKCTDMTEVSQRLREPDAEIAYAISSAIETAYLEGRSSCEAFHILLVNVGTSYTFSLEKDQWIIALRGCIATFTKEEDYMKCSQLVKLINDLKKDTDEAAKQSKV